jgi:MFS family permease
MAFAVQSIQKRLPKIIGPAIAGAVLSVAAYWITDQNYATITGMRALVGFALVLGIVSLLIQLRWMPRRKQDFSSTSSVEILREMHPALRRLLVAEVFTRWGDWLVREFVILYVMAICGRTAWEAGLLFAIQNTTALLTYLPIGRMTVAVGLQPFVGLTFVFFALFPLVLALVPASLWWLSVAFVVYGLREIGEPARKALITSLMPESVRAKGVGLYWGVRSFAICWASLVGAALWHFGSPQILLYSAFGFGCVGAVVYYVFCRGSTPVAT